jgi:putative molybdopterin biosynthesis protein
MTSRIEDLILKHKIYLKNTPLAKERYDLAVPEKFYKLDMIQKLMEVIRNDMEFKDTVANLGGYDITDMGKIVYPAPF